jgi:RNA polymerase sigma-70 factor (ECF subfamily)
VSSDSTVVSCDGTSTSLLDWTGPLGIHRVSDPRAELTLLSDLNPQAVADVHDRFFPELYRYAYYRTGEAQTSEDIAAETLARLVEAVARGRGPRSSLRGWLLGTAHHLVSQHYGQRYGKPEVDLPEEAIDRHGDPIGRAEKEASVRSLHAALARLTAEQQHVLALRFGGECSLTETASVMGKSVNAVKSLQFRALAALRRSLEESR